MGDTRAFLYRLPTGEVLSATRRRDHGDPRFAVVPTRDGSSWGLLHTAQSDDESVWCAKELFGTCHSAYVTQPEPSDKWAL